MTLQGIMHLINYALFMWAICLDHRKWTLRAGKQYIQEWLTKVSLYTWLVACATCWYMLPSDRVYVQSAHVFHMTPLCWQSLRQELVLGSTNA